MFSLRVEKEGIRFDVAMEDADGVHVVEGFEELIDVVLDLGLGNVVAAA